MWRPVSAVHAGGKIYRLGSGAVTEISYHQAESDDPIHYCDVSFDSRPKQRLFNLALVEME